MDEFSQATDSELLTVLTTSMGVRDNPLTVIITTASDVFDGPFYEMLQGYKSVLLGEYEDDTLFAHIFEPDLDDPEDELSTWKFQPTLPHGERHTFDEDEIIHIKFQPTLPHGERQITTTKTTKQTMFQPTLPHGERLSPSIYLIFN